MFTIFGVTVILYFIYCTYIYIYRFITKDEKNQVLVFTHGKTEQILFEFVSIFENFVRSLPSVIADVKMEGFDSTDSRQAFNSIN